MGLQCLNMTTGLRVTILKEQTNMSKQQICVMTQLMAVGWETLGPLQTNQGWSSPTSYMNLGLISEHRCAEFGPHHPTVAVRMECAGGEG